MSITKYLLSGIVLFIMSMGITVCDEQELEIFKASEFRITSDETLDILNIEYPQYVYTANKDIIDIILQNGDIILTSVSKGRTEVYIGDSIGLSNRARIIIYVDGTGKINIEGINKYDGKGVNANIKYAVTVNGIIGNEIAQTRIDLQMNGTHFIVTNNMDVTSWFKNIPSGLTAKIFEMFASDPAIGPNEVYIQFSGVPLSASSEEIIIVVPGSNAGRNWDVYFNTRSDARYNIIE